MSVGYIGPQLEVAVVPKRHTLVCGVRAALCNHTKLLWRSWFRELVSTMFVQARALEADKILADAFTTLVF